MRFHRVLKQPKRFAFSSQTNLSPRMSMISPNHINIDDFVPVGGMQRHETVRRISKTTIRRSERRTSGLLVLAKQICHVDSVFLRHCPGLAHLIQHVVRISDRKIASNNTTIPKQPFLASAKKKPQMFSASLNQRIMRKLHHPQVSDMWRIERATD